MMPPTVQVESAHKMIQADHGTVCSFTDDFFGYFSWPTVAKMQDGRLIVAASGFRAGHLCPFGRTVLCYSEDNGENWTAPQVLNDSPLDDRDAGVVAFGSESLLVSWFSSDMRVFTSEKEIDTWQDREKAQRYRNGFRRVTDNAAATYSGYWVRTSQNGGEDWAKPIRVPVCAPHGPINTGSGELLYLGKGYINDIKNDERYNGAIGAVKSTNGGLSWFPLGTIPCFPGTANADYYEPHAVELKNGEIVVMIRVDDAAEQHRLAKLGIDSFCMAQSRSKDGGVTWEIAQPLDVHGSPPHLLLHTAGAVVCSYGCREHPYGQRVMISQDGCRSWRSPAAARNTWLSPVAASSRRGPRRSAGGPA